MINTNKEKLLKLNVLGEISHPRLIGGRGYVTTWDGRPKLSLGYGGINYSVKVGDPVFGWETSDHVEPGVSIVNPDPVSNNALCSYSCIGNEAHIVTGDSKDEKGVVTGKSGYVMMPSNVLIGFSDKILEKLSIGDKIQVESKGLGLKIQGHEGVKIFGIDPELLEGMGMREEEEGLFIPVSAKIPPQLMGHGVGERPAEFGYWCIQTNCPESIEEYELDQIRIGDLVALIDQYCGYGRGYLKGALTIGVVVHGASDIAGHGPGVNPILTCKNGEIHIAKDSKANIGRYLELMEGFAW
jgi:hypothetical protein